MSSDDLDESHRVLQSIDDDSIINISDIVSKLQLGNQKFQNKIRGRKLKQRKMLRRKWLRLVHQMRKRSIQLAKLECDDEKRKLAEQEEIARKQAAAKEEADRYALEERLRREKEAKVTKSAAEYVRQKDISIEIDIDDEEEEEEEENQVFDKDLYELIEKGFFPPKSKGKNKSKGNDIYKDISKLELPFLQKELDDSTNKFMFNVFFGDAFKTIIHQQSKLADQTLKKCIAEKTMDRFKSIGPMLEGAANQ